MTEEIKNEKKSSAFMVFGGWVASAITIIILIWTSWSGGEVKDKELTIKGKTYAISCLFEPGLEKTIEDGKTCVLKEVGQKCEFEQISKCKIELKSIKEETEEVKPEIKTDEVKPEIKTDSDIKVIPEINDGEKVEIEKSDNDIINK